MKKHVIFFVIGILLICIGSIVTVFEVMEYDFIDEAYYGDVYRVMDSEEKFSIANARCMVIDTPDNDYNFKKVFVYDETLDDEVIIKYSYIDGLYTVNINEDDYSNGCRELQINYEFTGFNSNLKKFASLVINNLKEKKVYNYFKDFNSEITIVINPKYKNYIEIE